MIKGIKTLIALAAIFSFVSCGTKEENSSEVPAPVLVSTSPAQGAQDLAAGKLSVVFTYDQNIKCTVANQKLITVSPKATIASVGAYSTNLTISLEDLAEGTEYTVTVPQGAVEGYKKEQKAAEAASVTFKTKEAELPPPSNNQEPVRKDNDAWKMAEKLALGWNLGNHFDAFYNYVGAGDKFLYPSETCWGNPKCTKATFTNLKAAGFTSVRIPITWLNYIGPGPEYKIDETWMNRIIEVVGWARDAGLNVIINTHHDEDHYYGNESMGHRWLDIMDATTNSATNQQIKDKIAGFWTNVANTFKKEGDYLIFEGFNEINDGKWGGSSNSAQQAAVLNEWNQVFVDAVRATGGNNATRWLGVPTYCASPSFTKYFTMPTDPANHTMLAVHCYDPYNFTIGDAQCEQFGHTGAAGKKDGYEEKNMRDMFGSLYANYINKGIPVYMGEFGCSMRDYGSTAWNFYKYYLEYFVKCAKTYGLSAFLWDNGNKGSGAEHHPYIDHGTGAFIGHSEELVKVMVKAMTSTDSKYTLDYVYNNAPSK